MKSNRDTDSTSPYSEPDRGELSQLAQVALAATAKHIKARRELAVVIVLGICGILSALFLLTCLRSMIPVDGILNWNGVRVGNDFIVFYSSALLALGGEAAAAYDLSMLSTFQYDALGIETDRLPWRYPPVYFLFLLPFAYLSYLGAFWVWSALTVLALMVVVRLITPNWYSPLLVPLCLPVAYTMVAGQNGNLTAAVIGAGLIMLPRSAIFAGILFGLLVYKPQLAVVIPFCLIAGSYYRALFSMMVTALSLGLLSWLVFGADAWIAFFQGLVSKSNSTYGTVLEVWERIPTVIITALQMFESSSIAWILQGCVAILAITLSTLVWRTSTMPGARALALVAATPLVSPHVLDYDMAILVIPIAFLASDAWNSKWTAGRFLVLLCMWIAEPMLRVMSGKIGLQLGPFLWAILLGYSIFLVKREQGRGAREILSGGRRHGIREHFSNNPNKP